MVENTGTTELRVKTVEKSKCVLPKGNETPAKLKKKEKKANANSLGKRKDYSYKPKENAVNRRMFKNHSIYPRKVRLAIKMRNR